MIEVVLKGFDDLKEEGLVRLGGVLTLGWRFDGVVERDFGVVLVRCQVVTAGRLGGLRSRVLGTASSGGGRISETF